MENASKALIIAGGILISLLVISLLVFFFNNLSELQKINLTSQDLEKVTEFNKQYDAYARNVYGSELLSIANKVNDYNRREAEILGYSQIELYVEIKTNIDKEFFKKGIYVADKLIDEVDRLEERVKTIGNESIKSQTKSSRKVSELATMRTKDIEDLGFAKESYSEKVNKYNTYKNLLTQIKAKIFKYVNFEYDKYNGRIIKMYYEL